MFRTYKGRFWYKFSEIYCHTALPYARVYDTVLKMFIFAIPRNLKMYEGIKMWHKVPRNFIWQQIIVEGRWNTNRYYICASKLRKASDVWRLQEKWPEVNDVLWITNTRRCAADCSCSTIYKFTREFHFDTLYFYKIPRHVDFISISTQTKLFSKLPYTSGGFLYLISI